MSEGNQGFFFGKSHSERLAEQRLLLERENALRFSIWYALFMSANGRDFQEEILKIGVEMQDLEGVKYFGVRQLMSLADLGRKDPDVKSLYEFMATARHDHPKRNGGEFEDVTTLLRVATLIHAWGDDKEIDRIIKGCHINTDNIHPQVLLGVRKFINCPSYDHATRAFIANLIPLTDNMVISA